MLAADRALGTVAADRHEPEQRVEIEPAERSRVRAHAQVTLTEQRLRAEWQRHRHDREEDGEGRARQVEPGDSNDRQRETERGVERLARDLGQLADLVQAVRALGHVGGQPTLEVAVGQARDLAQERDAQAQLELPADAQDPGRQRDLEQGQRDEEQEDRRHRAESLGGETEIGPQVQQAAEQQRLEHDPRGGEAERAGEDSGHEEAVRAQQA